MWALRLHIFFTLRKNRYLLKYEKNDCCVVFKMKPWSIKVSYILYNRKAILKKGFLTWKETHNKIILLKLFKWRKRG